MYWTLLLIETIHEKENFVKEYESSIKVIRKMYTVHFLPLMILRWACEAYVVLEYGIKYSRVLKTDCICRDERFYNTFISRIFIYL